MIRLPRTCPVVRSIKRDGRQHHGQRHQQQQHQPIRAAKQRRPLRGRADPIAKKPEQRPMCQVNAVVDLPVLPKGIDQQGNSQSPSEQRANRPMSRTKHAVARIRIRDCGVFGARSPPAPAQRNRQPRGAPERQPRAPPVAASSSPSRSPFSDTENQTHPMAKPELMEAKVNERMWLSYFAPRSAFLRCRVTIGCRVLLPRSL